MFKPLSRRLNNSHWHFSKSFSPPKICTNKKNFFTARLCRGYHQKFRKGVGGQKGLAPRNPFLCQRLSGEFFASFSGFVSRQPPPANPFSKPLRVPTKENARKTLHTNSSTQRKTKGQQLKGKIVSALFHTVWHFPARFHTFLEFIRLFLQDFLVEVRGLLLL